LTSNEENAKKTQEYTLFHKPSSNGATAFI